MNNFWSLLSGMPSCFSVEMGSLRALPLMLLLPAATCCCRRSCDAGFERPLKLLDPLQLSLSLSATTPSTDVASDHALVAAAAAAAAFNILLLLLLLLLLRMLLHLLLARLVGHVLVYQSIRSIAVRWGAGPDAMRS
jgi:hypothetical protein